MKPETRLAYEKRIKELERENSRLQLYRYAVLEIFDGITSMETLASGLNVKWVLKIIRRLVV